MSVETTRLLRQASNGPMRQARTSLLALAFLAACGVAGPVGAAGEYKGGDEVAAAKDSELKAGDKSFVVRKGEKLVVEQTQGKWLWVRSGESRGWIDLKNVVGPNDTAVDSGQQRRPDYRVRLEGQRVAVHNAAGHAQIVRGTGDAVVVEVFAGGRDASRLRFAVENTDGGKTLRVVYPSKRVVYGRGDMGSFATMLTADGSTITFSGNSRNSGRIGGDGVILATSLERLRETFGTDGTPTEGHADLIIQVPPKRALSVELAVGNLTVNDVEADIQLRSAMGKVTGSKIQGTTLGVRTSGSVQLLGIRASNLEVRSGREAVELQLASDVERLTVWSGGEVTVRVPKVLGAEFELSNMRGVLDVQVPVTPSGSQRGRVRGTIGDGRGEMEITGRGIRLLPVDPKDAVANQNLLAGGRQPGPLSGSPSPHGPLGAGDGVTKLIERLRSCRDEGSDPVPILTSAIQDQDGAAKMYAIRELGRMGTKAVPALTKCLGDESFQVRMSAVMALGRMGREAADAMPSLKKCLTDEHPAVRHAAGNALGQMEAGR